MGLRSEGRNFTKGVLRGAESIGAVIGQVCSGRSRAYLKVRPLSYLVGANRAAKIGTGEDKEMRQAEGAGRESGSLGFRGLGCGSTNSPVSLQ